MPHVVANDTPINLAPGEVIVFRVHRSLNLLIAQLVGIVILAVLLMVLFRIGGINEINSSVVVIIQIFTLSVLAFMALIFILDYLTTFYTATTRRVQKDSGIITHNSLAIPLDEISNLNTKQSLLGLIFNYGDIIIRSESSPESIITFRGIAQPKLRREEMEDHLP